LRLYLKRAIKISFAVPLDGLIRLLNKSLQRGQPAFAGVTDFLDGGAYLRRGASELALTLRLLA
jgi:hypothetical protein